MHGALVLADDLQPRLEYRDKLKRAYNDRSQIVHSNREAKLDERERAELADIARRVCLHYVTSGRADFDSIIFGN